MKRILIAEDHKIVRIGTTILLKEMFPDTAISEADTFRQALQLVAAFPDSELLILDINIPGGGSISMIDAIRLRNPVLRILIFSSYDEQIYALRYVQAGANGYLSKDASDEEFCKAVNQVLSGQLYLSPAVYQQQLIERARKNKIEEKAITALSNREIDVMQLLIKGASTSEISEILNLQLSTVSTYKSRVFEKLGVHNIVELIEVVKLDGERFRNIP